MTIEDKIRVRHMIDACEELLSFSEGRSRRDFDTDRMLILSIIKDIEIIGEAANKVSEETKLNYPDIPWAEIIGMRNRLIHSYFDVDTEIVWTSVTNDVPELLSLLRNLSN